MDAAQQLIHAPPDIKVQNDAHFNLLLSTHVPNDYYPRWVHSTDFPPPPDNLVTVANERKMQRVDDDINAIRMGYSSNLLGILIKFPEEEVGKDFPKEMHVPFPPYENETFRINMSKILNSVVESKYSYLIHEFQLHRDGALVPVEMDREILRRYSARHIPWNTANIDLFGPNYNGIFALYQGHFNPLQPPPPALRTSSAYQSSLVNKSRCPSPETMRSRLGQQRYDVLDRHCIDQLGMIGGADSYLKHYQGAIVVMPGNQVDDSSFMTHPHHFDKQASKAGLGAGLWNSFKEQYFGMVDAIARRAHRMKQRTLDIRAYLQSAGYAQRSARSDAGQHAYANSNIIRATKFHLCHEDRRNLHLPGVYQEYGKSLWIQVLATEMLRMVHAIGMDSNNTPGNNHLMKWDVPIPVISSFHVSNGPVSHPILGSIVTSSETWYRPTLRPLRFRYALRSRSNERD
eukprot:scaffold2_cov132-Skeletonema_menzelii.AAC.8